MMCDSDLASIPLTPKYGVKKEVAADEKLWFWYASRKKIKIVLYQL